ncbi:MAG: phosphonate ABC transporter ATP-binding protein [bacterium]|nr:phosphonate ABC transporter ATP-binding protein [bacterium]
MGDNNIAVRVENVTKVFPGPVRALEDVSLEVEQGEFLVVIGLSGSGKSTLLRCINRLHDPTEGRIWVFGDEMTGARGTELRKLRASIGMIFQQFNLVKRHTVMANVLSGALGRTSLLRSLTMRYSDEERRRAQACLDRVGLGDRGGSRADALSGGQQQRVAVARALMQDPKLFLADEPVASLDPALRHSVMRHLEVLNREEGLTVVCTLHDVDLIQRYATRLMALRDGKLVYEGDPQGFNAQTFKDIYGEEAEPATGLAVEA